jgi:hypothetical protein
VNLEKTLDYYTHHSESIIQWLFLAILVMVAFLIARWLFGKVEASASAGIGSASGSAEIQEFLQKMMSQTAKLEAVPLQELSPAAVGDVDAQVQALKKELASREEEIKALKAAGDKKADADAVALGERIKELEAKLAEYEILEDDIADLSLYKEENARLKAELEKGKGTTAETEPPAPAPAAAAAAGEDIVAEFAQAVGQESVADAVVKAPLNVAPAAEATVDIASAVALEKKMAGAEPAPAPAPAAPAAAKAEGDDLFAEFAESPPESAAAEVLDAGLDTDKMMAEMASLVSDPPASGGGLDESTDVEKMAAEATNLTKS